jgi:hypothetical protein
VQAADIVLNAARRIAGEGGYVTLPQLQADPEVDGASGLRTAARVVTVMNDLENHGHVRTVASNPVHKWALTARPEPGAITGELL